MVYVLENTNTWVYAGNGEDKENIEKVKILSSVNSYSFESEGSLFLAAVPISRSLFSNFSVMISVEGTPVIVDTTYNDNFWKRVIGFCILIVVFFVFCAASWIYY